MSEKPTYEELEKRVQELEKIESEHKYFQEELRENENLFKRLYEKAPLGYQSLDENGHFIVVNQTWLDALGYTREEVIGKSFADFLHPDWRDHFKENFPRFKSIGEVLGVEFEMVKKNGNLIRVSFTGKIGRDKTGNFQQTHCIFNDITESKRAEEALREREEKYRLLFNMGVNVMFLVDSNTTQILECNNKASQLFGYSSQELLSMKMTDLSTTPEATRRACQENVSKIERVYQKKDGGLISVDITTEHFYLTNRAVHLSAIRDITAKKHAEKALKESEERFNLAMDASRDGVYEWDLDTREIYYSPGWKRMLGYEPDELPDDFSVWEKLTRPEDVEKSWQIMKEVVEGKRERFEVEFEMRHKDGHWVHILSRSNLYKDAKGKPVRVVGTHVDITDNKHQRERLRLSESRYRKAQELGKVGNWEYNLKTTELWGSDEAKKIFGFDPDKDSFSIEEVESCIIERERVHQALVDLIENGKPYNLEYDIITKSTGKIKTIVSIAEIEKDGAKNPIKISGVIHEITERKKAEETLAHQQKTYEQILEHSLAGYWDWDIPTGDEYLSPTFKKMFGYEDHEMENRAESWQKLIFAEDLPGVVGCFNLHVESKGREPFYNEVRYHHKNGSTIWVICTGKVIEWDDDGKAKRMIGCHIDITRIKKAEQNLSATLSLLDAALESTEEGILVINSNGKITKMNQKFLELWQIPAELAISSEDNTLMQYAVKQLVDPEAFLTKVRELYDAPADASFDEIEFSDGRVFERYSQPQWLDKQIVGRVWSFRDVTFRKRSELEREKLQVQLTQAQKMESVGRLAGGVAHDFNNMLSVILGYTEIGLEQVEPGHPLHADLLEIQKASRRSADITRQLLAFARKQTIAPKELDLNATVEGMFKMLRRLIGEDIDLAWQPATNLWPVRMDPSQVDQILANLCVNARDAIADVGKITIETGTATLDEDYCADHPGCVSGDFVMLMVSDDGCGMDQEIQANLFEPFFTTKGVDKGTGLGLATVYGIVKQNNGYIDVASEPGRGTTFRIYLPRHVAPLTPVPSKDPLTPDAQGSETILLVEDEPSILRMTRMMLERMGYKVLTAGTPGEAIALAREHAGEIHLLMTDVIMPEMNGRDLAKNLLSLYPNLKRLFMSGYTANVIAHHGVLDEGVQFIQKPFAKQDLAIKVREVLNEAK